MVLLGMGLFTCWCRVLALPFFFWGNPVQCVCVRSGLLWLCHLAFTYPYFQGAVWDAWNAKVAQDLSQRQGFREGSGGGSSLT